MKFIFFLGFIGLGFVSIGQQQVDGKFIYVKADRDNWENCETGQGECNKIVIERSSVEDVITFEAPCGGTASALYFYKNKQDEPLYSRSLGFEDCPLTFTFTGLEDGFYYVSMVSCALGGTVQIELKTKK